MTDLHYLSATEALRRFRAHELSPVELTQAVIDRAEAVEPVVNALCHRFFDEALEQARDAEGRYMGRGEAPRPLEGIPLAIKEEEAVAGQPWTQGSLIYRDLVAEESSCFAAAHPRLGRDRARALHRAGVLLRRLHALPAVGRHPQPVGPGVGRRRFVRRRRRRARIGHDHAGQRLRHRRLDPHPGLVQRRRRLQAAVRARAAGSARSTSTPTATAGRSPAPSSDALLFENVLAGPHPADVVSLRPKLELPDRLEGIEGMRIAYSVDLGGWPVDADVAANARAAAEALREAGALVEEVDLALPIDMVRRAAAIHFNLGFAAWVAETAKVHRDEMTAYALEFARWTAEAADGGTMMEKLDLEARLYPPVADLLERHDALICPTVTTRGLVAGDDYVGHGLEVRRP